jgi:hypothetical protein
VSQVARNRPQDVQRVPLVRSNDIVTVTVRRGGITVKRPLKARSEGAAGDTITGVAGESIGGRRACEPEPRLINEFVGGGRP